MKSFTSADLQKRIGEVLSSTESDPTVLLNRGQPRVVLLSASEFRRLKAAAGEPVPAAALPRRSLVLRGGSDPLGYDTSNLIEAARRMADDALSGRTASAVQDEMDRVRARLRASGAVRPQADEGRPRR